MNIRIAKKEDYKIVDIFHLKLHDYHCDNKPEYFKRIDGNFYSKKDYYSRLKNGTVYFIASINDEDVGMISISPYNGDYYTNLCVNSFYVEEKYRRQGVGSKLFSYAIEYASKNFSSGKYSNYVDLSVSAFNTGAIEFYKKNGFEFNYHGMSKKFKEG